MRNFPLSPVTQSTRIDDIMDKDHIRRHVRARKELLGNDERLQASDRVMQRLERLAAFLVSEHILVYHSLPDELGTHNLLEKWHTGKRFYLPRVNGVNLDILPYEQTGLEIGSFHIEEPTGNELHDISEMDMIIVPAVAYDRRGNRIGRGKGFYDRLLADTKALKIGIAYDFQLFDEISASPHDVPVDIVITESHTIVIHHT